MTPPGKSFLLPLEKSTIAPLKNPSDAHVRYEDHAWERNFVYCSMDMRFTTFAMRLEIENALLRNTTVCNNYNQCLVTATTGSEVRDGNRTS